MSRYQQSQGIKEVSTTSEGLYVRGIIDDAATVEDHPAAESIGLGQTVELERMDEARAREIDGRYSDRSECRCSRKVRCRPSRPVAPESVLASRSQPSLRGSPKRRQRRSAQKTRNRHPRLARHIYATHFSHHSPKPTTDLGRDLSTSTVKCLLQIQLKRAGMELVSITAAFEPAVAQTRGAHKSSTCEAEVRDMQMPRRCIEAPVRLTPIDAAMRQEPCSSKARYKVFRYSIRSSRSAGERPRPMTPGGSFLTSVSSSLEGMAAIAVRKLGRIECC